MIVLTGGFQISKNLQERNAIQEANDFVLMTTNLIRLVDEFQAERGQSLGFVRSGGNEFENDLFAQRKKTDEVIVAVRKDISVLAVKNNYWGLKPSFNKLSVEIDFLPSIRKSVDGLDTKFIFSYYTEFNSIALNLVQFYRALTSNIELSHLASSFSSVLWIKEHASRERGAVNAVLASKELSTENLREIISSIASQNELLRDLSTLMNSEDYSLFLTRINAYEEISGFKVTRENITNKSQKNELLSSLQSQVGYGGLIHNFKNFVIRGKKENLKAFQDNYLKAEKTIQIYQALEEVSSMERNLLTIISNTIRKYKKKLLVVEEMRGKEARIEKIDKAVSIDDNPSLQAIYGLRIAGFGMGASVWWDLATKRINVFENEIKSIALDIKSKEKESLKSVNSFLIYHSIALFLILLIIITLVNLIIKRVSTQVMDIAMAMDKMRTDEGFRRAIDIKGDDEIATMARAFNSLILQRLETEEELKIVSKFNDLILSAVSEGIYGLDVNGNTTFVNSIGLKLLGYSLDEVMGKSQHSLIHYSRMDGSEYPREQCPISQTIQTGTPHREDNEVFWKKDGTPFPVEYTSNPIYQENNVVGAVVTFSDISDRLKAATELQRETDIISLLEKVGDEVNKDNSLEDTLKFSLEQICALTHWQIGHVYLFAKDRPDLLVSSKVWHLKDPNKYNKFKEVTEKTTFEKGIGLPGRVIESRKVEWITDVRVDPNFPRNKLSDSLLVKGGFAFPILVQDRVAGVLEFFSEDDFLTDTQERDDKFKDAATQIGIQLGRVIERQEMETKLLAEKSRTQAILDNVVDGIITIDEKGFVQSFNPASERIFGYSKNEVLGKNVKFLMPEPYHSEHDSYLKSYLTSGVAKIINIGREVEGLRKDKTVFPLELAISELYVGEDRIFTGIVRDISERKQFENQLKKTKEEAESANRAKSIFLANMSHEIRTPMNAVLGYSQILLRKKNLDQDTKESIQTIDNSGKNLLKLINEILDISKIEAGKTELNITGFDLKVLIDNLSSMFELRCKQKQLHWNVKGPSDSHMVLGDETKLRQILVNLLGNAIKFTESGEVSFFVTTLENNQFRFDIIDTGNGIPLEAQKKIFDPFQQDEEGSKKGGTGLGLAISKKYLELMGVDLILKSERNEGAQFQFTLTLPTSTQNISSNKYRSVLSLAPNFKVKALVVDDVKENRDVLSKLLSSTGVEVIEAENGKEGVEKTREHHPDIVFMDMRMPVMRGEEAAKLIQQEFGVDNIKLVSITASAFDLRRQDFLDLGFHDYISKPFKEEQIFQSLKELLNIEFIYEDENNETAEVETIESIDISDFSLPEKLINNIKTSADLYNVTELEKGIEEIALLEGEKEGLQSHLRVLLKNYDMDGILEAMNKVSIIKASIR